MKVRSTLKLFLSLSLLLMLVLQLVIPSGCANIIPPEGGPRDTIAPTLRSVRPADSSRNFTGKRIVFEFDEFVDVDNPRDNLLVSPLPKIDPVIEHKLRTVTVVIKDTLQPNTTYSIDFGNAIKDVNEGNPVRNFRYIFTTGNQFDSLEVTGNVIVAETGKPDTTLIVMLHSNLDDSAVVKDRPKYIARLRTDGQFRFTNLPAGTYAIYALKDEGGQRRYLNKSQLFAFSDSTVNTAASPAPITLYAYVEKEDEERAPAGISGVAPGIRPGNQRRNGASDQLAYAANTVNDQLDLLENLEITFSTRLRNFDSTKVRLTNENFEPLSGYYFLRDTSEKLVTMVYRWTESTPYNVLLEKDFATDTAGRQLARNDTISFRMKAAREYGEIRLRLLNLDMSKNPVIQFVQGSEVKYSYPLTSRNFNARLFPPGDYDLRILFDDNKNGKWDPGEFFKVRRQPEKVLPISRKLTVKANWLNEVDITL